MEGTKEYNELKKVEQILKNQVDNDFFQDPIKFQPLPRVIDVLGAQLLEAGNHNNNSSMNIFARADIQDNGIPSDQPYADSSNKNNDPLTKSITDFDNLHKTNPAYLAMKKQQSTVEEAITHMATHHFSDLNASVVHVGRVSKQFDDAVGKVKGLKRRVMSIRENLATANEAVPGMTTHNNDASDRNNGDGNEEGVAEKGKGRVSTTTMVQTGGNSLRELWLKKLECEAVLSLLQKLEIIRETPSAFDALLHPTTTTTLSSSSQNESSSTSIVKNTPCRIGAAVVLLSDALTTMFSDDVAQIQALHKIMEQLMTRKQRAEEILWESLQDVLYLRTGNGIDTSINGENDDLGEEKKDGEDSQQQQKQQQRPQTSVGESNSHRNEGNSSTGGGSGSYKESSSSPNKSSHHRRMRRSSLQSSPRKHRFISVRDGRRSGGMDSDSDSDEEYDDYDDDGSTSRYSGSRSKTSSSKQQQQRPYTAPIGKSFDGDNEANGGTATTTTTSTTSNSTALNPFANFHGHYGRLLPRAMVESEIDLEVDEMRCLESSTFNTTTNSSNSTYNNSMNGGSYLSSEPDIALPRYTDPILALRILIEALAKLGRLDDVERIIAENVERELRRIGQLEQAKTLSRFERLHLNGPSSSSNNPNTHPKQSSKSSSSSRRRRMMDVGDLNQNAAEEKLKIFKSHLRNLLKAFGSVMLRLSHLAQILRHRITSDPKLVTPSYATPSSALHSVLVNAHVSMQKEIKAFLKGCLMEANNTNNPESSTFSKNNRTGKSSLLDSTVSNRGGGGTTRSGVSAHEQGIFSLGIITDASLASSIREKYAQNLTSASRSTAMRMTPSEFVTMILCPKTGTVPQIRHALFFRKSLAAWTQECIELKKELATTTREDTSSPEYNATTEETALEFLDDRVKNDLLPMLQDAAVDGTVSVLEKADAFEPITRSDMYTSPLKSQERRVEMNAACNGLFTATGPLFSALQRLPRGGEMYAPLVAHLDHAILTLISRVKQRIQHLCQDKTAFAYLEDPNSKQPTQLSYDVEARRPFSQLWSAYFENDGDMSPPDSSRSLTGGGGGSIAPLTPSKSDTQSKMSNNNNNNEDEKLNQRSLTADLAGGETDLQREQETFEQEVMHLLEILNFANPDYGKDMLLCTEEEFLKIASLAHSLLTLASLLERRLKPKKVTWGKTTTAPRALRESIKNIRTHGLRVAKFCRIEVLLQAVRRMSLLYKSNSLASKDVVRLPTCVNDFGEYLTSISDVLREYGGNKITAYSLSSLEQYIPLFLMETVRVVAQGTDLPDDFKITLHGVEALHKSCSVLYRDLKAATTFDHSFWDDDVAADAFERAANFIALMELDMEELVSYCRENRNEFTDADYKLMFAMNGPRRKGDRTRYSVLQEHFGE